MKAIAKRVSFILIAIGTMAPAALRAGDHDPKVEKKKSYSKTYSLSSSDLVNLEGRFGDMKVNTWDRNEIKVDADISVSVDVRSGNSDKEEQMAQDMLDRIHIEDGKSGGKVFFKTVIDDHKQNNNYKNVSTNMKINLTVYLPASQKLDVHNEFGKLIMPDYDGELSVESKFGAFTAGKLAHSNKVWVEFGSASIGEMNNGALTVKFSKAEVSSLKGSVKAQFEFCGGVKLNLSNSLKDLTIKNSYTQLMLDASENLSATYDIYTNFSKLRNKSNFTISEKDDDDDDRGPKFDRQYNGKSGSGSVAIKVKSEFGDVILGHNLPFDINAKDEKEKHKATSI